MGDGSPMLRAALWYADLGYPVLPCAPGRKTPLTRHGLHDAAVRSWPPIEPMCLRWEFPVWTPTPDLDPAALRSEKSKRRKRDEPDATEREPPWDVQRFVETFILEARTRDAIIAAANTFGHGADVQYVGRNQLDAATLDRFAVGTVFVDYDKNMEWALVRGILDEEQANPLAEWVWGVREAIRQHRLRRIMSTRTILNSARLIAAGEALETIRQRYFTSWSEDERRLAH